MSDQPATAPRLDAMIAGAQKAGTTSLGRYLDGHADIRTHTSLEFPYFVNPQTAGQTYTGEFNRRFAADSSGASLVLAKSVGVMFVPGAAERLHAHNPDVRLIVMVREPVARAYSAYWFQRSVGLEDPEVTFEQALSLEERRLAEDFERNHHLAYAGRGRYAPQISNLIDQFGHDRVLTVVLEQLTAEPQLVLGRVAEFLGVDPSGLPADASRRHNQRRAIRSPRVAAAMRRPMLRSFARRIPHSWTQRADRTIKRFNAVDTEIPSIAPATAAELAIHFAEQNQDLERLLGQSLKPWWG